MADFTEEELQKAVAGEESAELTGIEADLAEEFKEPEETQEQVAEQPEPQAEQPAEQETPAEPEQTAEKLQEQEEQPEQGAAEKPEPTEEPKLILGKFKSQEDLEKAYQNLEKRFGEKAQEVKEVQQVTSDDFDRAVDQKVIEVNMAAIEKALSTISDPEKAKEAQYLWSQAQRTGSAEMLEQARGFLDPRVDRRLEAEMMNNGAQIRMMANAHKREITMKPLVAELDNMAEEDPDFMNDTQNQDLLAMAIRIDPSVATVRSVKSKLKDYAKSNYERGYEAARKEFAKQAEKKTVSVKSTTTIEEPAKPKKAFKDMSITEQLEEEMKSLL
jgi:hypothetical protein